MKISKTFDSHHWRFWKDEIFLFLTVTVLRENSGFHQWGVSKFKDFISLFDQWRFWKWGDEILQTLVSWRFWKRKVENFTVWKRFQEGWRSDCTLPHWMAEHIFWTTLLPSTKTVYYPIGFGLPIPPISLSTHIANGLRIKPSSSSWFLQISEIWLT